jgi:hypothetical protein
VEADDGRTTADDGGTAAGYRTKNKNPTQRCVEQKRQLLTTTTTKAIVLMRISIIPIITIRSITIISIAKMSLIILKDAKFACTTEVFSFV